METQLLYILREIRSKMESNLHNYQPKEITNFENNENKEKNPNKEIKSKISIGF